MLAEKTTLSVGWVKALRNPPLPHDGGFRKAFTHHTVTENRKPRRIDMSPLESLVACGTKLWLDSVDPDEVTRNLAFGATGATSNPIIISDLIKTGRFDEAMARFFSEGLNDEDVAWKMTDLLVKQA